MSSVKVTGGLSKKWKQTVVNGDSVKKAVISVGQAAKQKSEAKVSASYETHFQWHFGAKALYGPWGVTYLFWPTSPMARKHQEYTTEAVSNLGLKKNPRGE